MLKNRIKKGLVLSLISIFFVVSTSAQDAAGDVAKGESIFKNNCAQCHAVTDEVIVGPGLKGIEARRDFAWLAKWIKNPMAVVNSGDAYAVEIYNKYNKTQMTAFGNLTDADIRAVLDYVKAADAPAPAAAAGVAAAPVQQAEGGFLKWAVIGLAVLLGLVLIAMLALLNLLAKIKGSDASELNAVDADSSIKFPSLSDLKSNQTLKTAVIWLFILLGGKASMDGLFKIGVQQGYAPKQPIQFSHKLHAGEYKINCTYCHTGVFKGKQAGIPAANICMNCHNAIKKESPEIQKIYTAIEKDAPIEWVRVHNLPDLAYFNHAQHTNVGGLDCKNCHGNIDQMEVVQQRSSLTMGWCIDCHRKTDVNTKGNAYYDKLLDIHNKTGKGPMKVEDIGGLECSKCHY